MRHALVVTLAVAAGIAWLHSPPEREGLPPRPQLQLSANPQEITAAELLMALDAMTTRNSLTNWVDRVGFYGSIRTPISLMHDAFFVEWLHEDEITLAYAGLVDLELDAVALGAGMNKLIEARGARTDRDAVRISVLRAAASPSVLAAEVSISGHRTSTGYFVVWSRSAHGWVYRRSRSTWIACG